MNRICTCSAFAIGAAILTGGAAFPSTGHAVNIDYVFTQSNLPDVPVGYGTANVETVGNDLKFTLQLLNGAWFVDAGNDTQHHPVSFKLDTTGLEFGGLPVPFIGVSAGEYTNSPFGGEFNYAVNCPANGENGCGSHVSSLTFLILEAGSLQLQPLLTNGVYITADIFLPNANGSGGSIGEIGATLAPDTRAVPGPVVGAGLPGLIAGCFALLGLARWRRRQEVA